MRTLNLGILAHIDAGKTSLTERLLYTAGVIDEVGSVDAGSTQTDSLDLERQRGITIKSAVVSFVVDGTTINLIDTPGHPDFIAEVERVLSVLDGAVLVVSAVEGVQAQTRVLMRVLQRLRIPTLFFVNKIDRRGADPDRVVRDIQTRLTPTAAPIGSVASAGRPDARFLPIRTGDSGRTTALAEQLAGLDDDFLAAYLATEDGPDYDWLRPQIAAQSRRGLVHPVLFGSAITGAGVADLMGAVPDFLPTTSGDPGGLVAATAFKVERGVAGERIAYLQLTSGTIAVRDRVQLATDRIGVVTAINVFADGGLIRSGAAQAGQIAKVWGLGAVQIGDSIGNPDEDSLERDNPDPADHFFTPPSLETVVVPASERDRGAVHAALVQLAEQDPLINLRSDDVRHEISVSLYGEVQKEVIGATLASDYGLEVGFEPTTTICIERVLGTGAAVEVIQSEGNPFLATIGLRVEPSPAGSGVSFGYEIELGALPIAFLRAIEETVHLALQQGLRGWAVPDATVTLTRSGYWPRQSHMHATFDKSMSSTAGDFRLLTPLVLMMALRRAGTQVEEPIHRFTLEIPPDSYGPMLPALTRLGAIPHSSTTSGSAYVIEGVIPAAAVHELQIQLPGWTRGEGSLESGFDHYRPVVGPPPSRSRTDHNPLDRAEYLLHVQRRV